MHLAEHDITRLVEAFLEENRKLNLSAFRTPALCRRGNVDDALALLDAASIQTELRNVRTIIDMGTGGGFPLLPLSIALPATHCIGIDSIGKKILALERIAERLGLHNIALRSERLECTGHDPILRGAADLVTARALAELPVLLEYGIPLLRIGGLCAFWKSSAIADELSRTVNAQRMLGAAFVGQYDYDLGEGFGARCILFFRKERETPAIYPRTTGTPRHAPLR